LLLTAVASAALALGLVACGDDEPAFPGLGEPTATTGAGQAAAPTSTAQSGAAGTPTRPAGATPASGATPSATVSAASLPARLPDLNSYRYSMRMEGTAGLIAEMSELGLPQGTNPNTGTLVFEVRGSYVKPDRGEATISFSGIQANIVTIGRQQWQTIGGLVQGPTSLTSVTEEDYALVATFWDDSPTVDQFSCATRETVNGVSTRKCTADRSAIERASLTQDLLGGLALQSLTRGTAEIWLTDANKVIRLRLDLAGKDTSNRDVALKMDIDIMDFNATNIAINPPR
jgi:hypothetical protein